MTATRASVRDSASSSRSRRSAARRRARAPARAAPPRARCGARPRPRGRRRSGPRRSTCVVDEADAGEGRALRAGIATPSAASCATTEGISPSPHALSRAAAGALDHDGARVPRRRASIATASPTGPPPTISRSARTPRPRAKATCERHLAEHAQHGDRLRRVELARHRSAAAPRSPDLPARRARQRARLEDEHARRDESGALGDPRARTRSARASSPAPAPRRSTKTTSSSPRRRRHADGGAAAGAHARHIVDRVLDVLRRVVASAQHDQRPWRGRTGRARRRARKPGSPVSSQPSRSAAAVASGSAEVALHQRRPAHERARASAGAELGAVVVDDPQPKPGSGVPTLTSGRPSRRGARTPSRTSASRSNARETERRIEIREGHRERRLGEAVDRRQRLGPKAPAREALDEGAQRRPAPRARRRRARSRQRERSTPSSLLVADALGAERVGEVRRRLVVAPARDARSQSAGRATNTSGGTSVSSDGRSSAGKTQPMSPMSW